MGSRTLVPESQNKRTIPMAPTSARALVGFCRSYLHTERTVSLFINQGNYLRARLGCPPAVLCGRDGGVGCSPLFGCGV